jgi:UDP-N-acetylglucosamine 2-epimerase (non-hydrolysing)
VVHIGVVTAARSDYGLLAPLIEALHRDPDTDLSIYATGMHFSPRHGMTIDEVHQAEWRDAVVDIPAAPEDDSSEAAARALSRGVEGFAAVYAARRPDIVVVMGDRMDAMAGVIAALPFDIPLAHISGGELSEGVVDDRVRHAITKMSHIHFTSHPDFARRVIQLGEVPERVIVSGEPGLDLLSGLSIDPADAVHAEYGLDSERPISVFTFHPVGPGVDQNRQSIDAVLAAAAEIETQIVFTYPNADPGSAPIIDAIDAWCAGRAGCIARASLGRHRYLNLLNRASCMVGNSSSGLVEAPSFELPVVNIGARQKGRLSPPNVLSVPVATAAIAVAWRKALSPTFRDSLTGLQNPYGDGKAVGRIMEVLKTLLATGDLTAKSFHDLTGAAVADR